jgi:preprotein translocase subunit SecA
MPMIRVDQSDLIYRSEKAKFDAIIEDVTERYENGQPVLLGTASVAKSELLSRRLKLAGIPHQVLNAKQHEREAAVIAQAGRKGAITVATNMAGRGTDIMLGGNSEFLADLAVRDALKTREIDPEESPDEFHKEYEALWAPTLKELEEQVADEHEEVVAAGGLYVVGSERHESRRIDNQLRGRSGRQGDPGESRFYLSLEDDLMRLFKSDVVERVMSITNMPDDVPIEAKVVSNAIESAQKQVEAQNFEMRKNVLKYDDVMNRQRHAIYTDRRKVLEGADVSEVLQNDINEVVTAAVGLYTQGFSDEWDLDALWKQMKAIYPVTIKESDYTDARSQQEMVDAFLEDAHSVYEARETELGEDKMREFERRVWLSMLDRKWREHLYEMDYLREGIGLRAMAQRDPLVEYKREGAMMFDAMQVAFREDVVSFLFNAAVVQQRPALTITNKTDAEDAANAAAASANLAAVADSPDGVSSTAAAALGLGGKGSRPKKKVTALDEVVAGTPASASGPSRPLRLSGPSKDGSSAATQVLTDEKSAYDGVGRNDPCPCGSGKKFKNCHGRNPNSRG